MAPGELYFYLSSGIYYYNCRPNEKIHSLIMSTKYKITLKFNKMNFDNQSD